MASIAQDVAHQTLDSLQQRLQRVQFLLHGTTSSDVQDNPPAVMPQTQSIASRLHGLQTSFDSVLSASKSARDIVALQSRHDHAAPDMTDQALTALVLSHTPAYQATAARLVSLQDLPAPDPSSSAALIHLHPRLQRVASRQEEQQDTIAQLRHQSLAILARWYDLGIIGMDDCWTEWEARLLLQEKHVRRAETEKRQEQDNSDSL